MSAVHVHWHSIFNMIPFSPYIDRWTRSIEEVQQTIQEATLCPLQRICTNVRLLHQNWLLFLWTVFIDYFLYSCRIEKVTPADQRGPLSRLKQFLEVKARFTLLFVTDRHSFSLSLSLILLSAGMYIIRAHSSAQRLPWQQILANQITRHCCRIKCAANSLLILIFFSDSLFQTKKNSTNFPQSFSYNAITVSSNSTSVNNTLMV